MTDRSIADHPLAQLTLVRMREFAREPEAVFWTFLFPVLLTVALGLAFRNRADPMLKVGASPAVAAKLRNGPGLSVAELSSDAGPVALRNGSIALWADVGADGGVTLSYDDTNPDGRSARLLADSAIQRAAGRADPVRVADRVTHEPGSRYVDFVVPGLIGVGIMNNAVWGLGFSIVDTRRRNLTKRLLATPMSRLHYLAAYALWRVILLPVEFLVPLVFGLVAFGVPVRGSWIVLTGLCLLGSLAFSAIGVLVGSRARTIEALSGLVNLTILPMWIVSGVFFSAQRFPDIVQPLIKVLPLTALVDALRAVQLQGAPIGAIWKQLATLGIWLVVSFAAALKLFRWR
jgi:ABC-type multidrug transport system permease subunit